MRLDTTRTLPAPRGLRGMMGCSSPWRSRARVSRPGSTCTSLPGKRLVGRDRQINRGVRRLRPRRVARRARVAVRATRARAGSPARPAAVAVQARRVRGLGPLPTYDLRSSFKRGAERLAGDLAAGTPAGWRPRLRLPCPVGAAVYALSVAFAVVLGASFLHRVVGHRSLAASHVGLRLALVGALVALAALPSAWLLWAFLRRRTGWLNLRGRRSLRGRDAPGVCGRRSRHRALAWPVLSQDRRCSRARIRSRHVGAVPRPDAPVALRTYRLSVAEVDGSVGEEVRRALSATASPRPPTARATWSS
jgi:hypothetical protein